MAWEETKSGEEYYAIDTAEIGLVWSIDLKCTVKVPVNDQNMRMLSEEELLKQARDYAVAMYDGQMPDGLIPGIEMKSGWERLGGAFVASKDIKSDTQYLDARDVSWAYVAGFDDKAYFVRVLNDEADHGKVRPIFTEAELARMVRGADEDCKLGSNGWAIALSEGDEGETLLDIYQGEDMDWGETCTPSMLGYEPVFVMPHENMGFEIVTPKEAFEIDPNVPDPNGLRNANDPDVVAEKARKQVEALEQVKTAVSKMYKI
jgi:hypothetical protein